MAQSLTELMEQAIAQNASDIHLKTGNPPIYRVDGDLRRLEGAPLTSEDLQEYLKVLAKPQDIVKFEKVMELDLSYMFENRARFRVNVCRDDGDLRIVMRLIPLQIKTIEELRRIKKRRYSRDGPHRQR